MTGHKQSSGKAFPNPEIMVHELHGPRCTQNKEFTSQNLVPAKFVQDLNQNTESSYNIGNLQLFWETKKVNLAF